MYLWWQPRVATFDELSWLWRAIQQPPSTSKLIYWACQQDYLSTTGAVRVGAHAGFQFGPEGTAKRFNYGGYDNGDPAVTNDGGTCRGSLPTLPYNAAVSPFFDWQAERDYLTRIFKSPKQNWLAAELSTDNTYSDATHPSFGQQIRTGNQNADEVAWRCTTRDLVTGVETHIRDLLIPAGKTAAGAIQSAVFWDEDFNHDAQPVATVPWEVRWVEPRADRELVPTCDLNYGVDTLTNTDTFTDAVGYRMKAVTARTNAAGLKPHPGAVIRHATMAATGAAFAQLVNVDKPKGTAAGDELILGVCVTGDRSPVTVAGFDVLVAGPVVASADEARLLVFRKVAGAVEPAAYTIDQAVGAPMAVGLVAIYGPDPIADPVVSALDTRAVPNTVWGVPAFEAPTNYGRILQVVAGRPTVIGNDITVDPPATLERVDTATITGDWCVLFLGDVAIPRPAGTAPARSGSSVSTRWQGAQVLVYPKLQRAFPTADAAAGAWTTAPLWSKVDEATPDDADRIAGPTASTAILDVGDTITPSSGYAVRWRARRQNAATASLLVELRQGATLIASATQVLPAGDAFLEGVLNVSAAEAANITDPNLLRVYLTPTIT